MRRSLLVASLLTAVLASAASAEDWPKFLGPRGDSNGCVSFRNYPQFLQAYMRGDVKQLVVVTHRGDAPQGVFASRT